MLIYLYDNAMDLRPEVVLSETIHVFIRALEALIWQTFFVKTFLVLSDSAKKRKKFNSM